MAGEFGAWIPIGAVQTASGYDVAWEIPGANEYTVWSTDSNGNYISNLIGAVSGTSTALESFEPDFRPRLERQRGRSYHDGDPDRHGSTSLTEVGNNPTVFHLDNSSGSGPALKYAGADVMAGEFGAWTPIGAVQTASGYDVAWEIPGTNEYTVWSTNSSGNYISNLIGAVSGTSTALESFEPIFEQDLNGDGTIGLTTTVIQTITRLDRPA